MAMRRWLPMLAAFLMSMTGPTLADAPAWRGLIPDAMTADGGIPGWLVLGGKAPFRLDGREIVGTSVTNSRNSFLVSEATFGDFILEFEVKTHARLNTGVMIRAESRADYRVGVVHGYQVEIDPSARAWTGGIYDEQRRLWLAPPTGLPDTASPYRPGDWNQIRVEAIGPHIRTWVNGVATAHLVDDLTPRGFLGLQVHDVGTKTEDAGLEVRFSDLRIITDNPAAFATPLDANLEQDHIAHHETPAARALGTRLLWNGRDAAGWRGMRGPGWVIQDGVLTGSAGARSVFSADQFKDFDLSVDYRLPEGSSATLTYLTNGFTLLSPQTKGQGDGASGSLIGKAPARNLTDPNPDKPSQKPWPWWNRLRVVAQGDRVEHWLNGSLLLVGSRSALGLAADGPIALRVETGQLEVQTIRIRPLAPIAAGAVP